MRIVRTVALLLCGALAGCLLLVVLWTYFQDDACPFCGAAEAGATQVGDCPAVAYSCGTVYGSIMNFWWRSAVCVQRGGHDVSTPPGGGEVLLGNGAEKPKVDWAAKLREREGRTKPRRAIDELRRLEKKYGEANPKK